MYSVKTKDSLALNYTMLDDDGSKKSKSVVLSNLNYDVTDEDLYDVAVLFKDLIAYGVEKICRRSEVMFVED
ncbi:MAG: DUF1659 domain-containing protein [Oscillospiraceae bacterium]|nr:DUF1659 domain-containing protein [Oscillospiraceae bacterium]